jgi:hypothetical protein
MNAKHTPTPYEAKPINGWGDVPCITTVGGTRPMLKIVRDDRYYTDFVKTDDGSTILSDEVARKAGNYVATPEIKAEVIEREKATANFIVRACNAHDDLVEAAKAAEAIFARQKWAFGSADPEAVAMRKLRAALAKAGVAA